MVVRITGNILIRVLILVNRIRLPSMYVFESMYIAPPDRKCAIGEGPSSMVACFTERATVTTLTARGMDLLA